MTNSETKKFSQNVSSSYHLEDRNKNIPKLRFKGYNDEWVKYQLGKICKTYSGGTPNVSNLNFYNGEIPFIKSGEIHSNQTEMYITEDGLKNSSAKLVNRGDLLFALYGATSGEVDISKIDGAINQAILCVRSNYVNLIFLKEILSFNKNKILCKYLQGGQGNLSADIFKTLKFKFPTLPEQEKIASFLTLIDKKIEKQKELVELLKKYKRGLLSSIFSQKLRFKDNNGNDYPAWEEKTLGEVTDNISYGLNAASKDYDGENKYIRITDIDETTGKYNNSDIVSPDCVLSDEYKLKINDLLFARTGASTGKTYLYNENDGKMYFAGFLIKFSIKKEYCSNFLFYITQTYNYKKWVLIMSDRSGQPGINAKEYSKYKFLCPAYSEQVKISNIILKTDNIIEKANIILESYNAYKKCLLQKMFI